MHRLLAAFAVFALAAPILAQSGEQGSVCVHEVLPGVSCDSSTDVSVEELAVVSIDET